MNSKLCKKLRRVAKALAGDNWKEHYKRWKKGIRNGAHSA